MRRTINKLAATLGVALVAITFVAFSGVLESQFVNYDDEVYVTGNAHVLSGLSVATARWAFTTTEGANWHPLTWLSHLLDVTCYGLDAGKHHLSSLLFHAANTVLLFLLLARMTGALWRPAFAACLFAIHPLHVESVAWIAERKDVASTLFWLLTLFAWLRYVEARSVARYVLVVALFALGLMAKPMLVTLPFTLLLLDDWPLRRAASLNDRVWEKAPLFAMSVASCVVTIVVQRSGGAVQTLLSMTFPDRLANAAVSYASYLGKTAWPAALAVFYPFAKGIPAWRVVGSSIVLSAITAIVVRLRRRAPFLAFGWLWYAVTLVPVIGLVQVGGQAMADRYTYVPLIGIFIALAWGLAALAKKSRPARFAASAAAVATLFACVGLTRAQVAHWSDSTALFTHALGVTSDNWLAHNNLGLVLFDAGKTEESIAHYREALRIVPNYVEAHNNLGNALEKLGQRDEAMEHYRLALQLRPDYPRVHNNLGVALSNQGRSAEAIAEYREALRLDPGYAKAQRNLARELSESFETLNAQGLALAGANRLPEAIASFQRAVAARPESAEVRNNLAGALAASGRIDAAIEQLEQAVRLDPNNAAAHYNLGSSLFQVGRVAEAIAEFERTLELEPDDADARAKLTEARR